MTGSRCTSYFAGAVVLDVSHAAVCAVGSSSTDLRFVVNSSFLPPGGAVTLRLWNDNAAFSKSPASPRFRSPCTLSTSPPARRVWPGRRGLRRPHWAAG